LEAVWVWRGLFFWVSVCFLESLVPTDMITVLEECWTD
jgi:hypothetical protein